MARAFEKILIVMFENQYRSYVMENPYMRKLARAGCSMNNYFGAFHPSQTNYLASIAGEICGVSNDTPPPSPLPQTTLVGLMQPNAYAQRVSWKAYMEAYPDEPWNPAWVQSNYPADQQPLNEYPNDGTSLARYFRKHNPFASFHEIQSEENRWQNIVDDVTFWHDIVNQQLPEYSWFTPDIWNDGHYVYGTHVDTDPRYQLVAQLATWMEYVFFGNISNSNLQGGSRYPDNVGLNLDLDLVIRDPQKAYAQSRIPPGTLVVVTWDEADYNAKSYDTNYDGQNQIYTVLLGDMIEPGSVIDTPYNHYNLIKTIQRNFELPSLGKNDHEASSLRFLWDEQFAWQQAQSTPFTAVKQASICEHHQGFSLIYSDANGQLFHSRYETIGSQQNQWREPSALGLSAGEELCLASLGEQLILVFSDSQGEISYCSCSYNNEAIVWSAPQTLLPSGSKHLCLCHYHDYADQEDKLMLAWQEAHGEAIMSLRYQTGQWDEKPVAVGQYSDGPMAIAALGPSLYLVYQQRNSFNMRMTSYNTAPFNAT